MRLAAVRPPAPTHHTPPIVLGCDETPGLESADVSLKQAQVNIRLNADNALMMTKIRAVLKPNGYPTRDPRVEAHGRIVLGRFPELVRAM
jgi:hypothetical protein